MDFARVLQKASIVCPNSGRCTEDHLVDFAEMIPPNRQLAARRRGVKWVDMTVSTCAPHVICFSSRKDRQYDQAKLQQRSSSE